MTAEELQARQRQLRAAEAEAARLGRALRDAIREAGQTQTLRQVADTLGITKQRVWQLRQLG